MAVGQITAYTCNKFAPTSNTATRLAAGSSVGFGGGNSFYIGLGGNVTTNATESNAQYKMKVGGSLSNGAIMISGNTVSSGTITCRARKGGGYGNINISITNSTTGLFEDTSNTDTVSVDDLWCWEVATGSNGTLTTTNISAVWTNTDSAGAFPLIWENYAGSGQTLVPMYFVPTDGNGTSSVEANVKMCNNAAGTLSKFNLSVNINSTASYTATFRVRIDGANGNQSIIVPIGTTGFFIDNSNTDTVTDSSIINYSGVADGADVGTCFVNTMGVINTTGVASGFSQMMMISN